MKKTLLKFFLFAIAMCFMACNPTTTTINGNGGGNEGGGSDPVELSSITITSAPNKLLYKVGESFSDSGLVLTATYVDGSNHTVNPSSVVADTSSVGIKTLTVTYTENGVTKDATTNYYVRSADSLTETPVSTGGNIYKFGDFPQTISKINVYSSEPVYNGWYLGSDGYFYEKVTAWLSTGGSVNHICSDGTELVHDQVYYFKVEPIKWKKLTDNYNSSGNALLLAETILKGGICYNHNEENRIINGQTIYPNNYKYSTIRAYLNGSYESGDSQPTTYSGNGFLQIAFTTGYAAGRAAATAVPQPAF